MNLRQLLDLFPIGSPVELRSQPGRWRVFSATPDLDLVVRRDSELVITYHPGGYVERQVSRMADMLSIPFEHCRPVRQLGAE